MRLHWKLRKAIGFHHKHLKRVAFDVLRECVRQRLKRKQEIDETMHMRYTCATRGRPYVHPTKRKRHIWIERDHELALVQMYRRSLNPNHRDHPILGSQLTKEGIKQARDLQQFYDDREIFEKICHR